MVPLIRKIKEKNSFELHGIFQSPFHCEQVFEGTHLLDKIIVLPQKRKAMIQFVWKKSAYYDFVYLNHVSTSLIWLIMGSIIGRKNISNQKRWLSRVIPNLSLITPQKENHIILQNLNLIGENLAPNEVLKYFHLKYLNEDKSSVENTRFKHPYITLQISAGNNIVQYKNWPPNHWISFLRQFNKHLPQMKIFLIGEKREAVIADKIISADIPGVISMVGSTTLRQAISLIRNSTCFIGLDSGLMHMAVCLGRPTFILWGPTSPSELGYEQFDSKRHRDICLNLYCHPCLAWPEPNSQRVKSPNNCPDKKCITALQPAMVFSEFWNFWENLSS